MRALAQIFSDLAGCVEGAPLLQHVGRQWTSCLVICKCVVAPMVACRGVCEVIRARGDAVRPKGSSVRDVADIVSW